tara:strand:- start:428 stop:628 length:201 start_codon:yes stop_codon:yes gene_type:complete
MAGRSRGLSRTVRVQAVTLAIADFCPNQQHIVRKVKEFLIMEEWNLGKWVVVVIGARPSVWVDNGW